MATPSMFGAARLDLKIDAFPDCKYRAFWRQLHPPDCRRDPPELHADSCLSAANARTESSAPGRRHAVRRE